MGPFTLIRGSVYAVYTVPYCAALLIVSEYRGDLVYKNSAMRATCACRGLGMWERSYA